MIDISITELRGKLGDLLNQVIYGGERISIHRHGKTAAVIVTKRDWELLEAIESKMESKAFQSILQQLEDPGPVFVVRKPSPDDPEGR